MLFHVVPLVLLSMVAFSTALLLVEVIQQPISYHGEQIEGYHMKEDKNLCQKLGSKVTLQFVWGHPSKNNQCKEITTVELA